MKKAGMTITDDEIILGINKSELLADYAFYMFQYYGIEFQNRTVVFNDCRCKLVRKRKGGYKWQ